MAPSPSTSAVTAYPQKKKKVIFYYSVQYSRAGGRRQCRSRSGPCSRPGPCHLLGNSTVLYEVLRPVGTYSRRGQDDAYGQYQLTRGVILAWQANNWDEATLARLGRLH